MTRNDGLQQVQVITRGVYNGAEHRSLGVCEAGALIDVPAGAYANSLIESGLVRIPVPVELELAELTAAIDSAANQLGLAPEGEGVDPFIASETFVLPEAPNLIPENPTKARSRGKTRE